MRVLGQHVIADCDGHGEVDPTPARPVADELVQAGEQDVLHREGAAALDEIDHPAEVGLPASVSHDTCRRTSRASRSLFTASRSMAGSPLRSSAGLSARAA